MKPTRLLTALLAVLVCSTAFATDRENKIQQREAALSAARDAVDLESLSGSREIDPDADLLVVIDTPLLSYLYEDFEAAVEASDHSFAYWNIALNGELPDDMIGSDWNAILLFADNTGLMPTRDYAAGQSPWIDYLMDGGNLFYSDQDYFFANGESFEPSFGPGDLAYDAFGIASGVNDGNSEDDWFGVADDPISGDFATDAYVTNYLLTFNWEDFASPVDDATEVFSGASTGESGGIRFSNDFGGETIYLSFNSAAAAEGAYPSFTLTEQFSTLLDDLAEYFLEDGPATLDLMPQVSTVPAEGGTIVYDVHLVNNTPMTVPGLTFWTNVTLPNGQVFGPLLQQGFTAQPFMDVFVTGAQQNVPQVAPAGTYAFHGHVGFYPNATLSDEFDFEKLATVAGGSVVQTWQGRVGVVQR